MSENPQRVSPFDAIRQVDDAGNEYWSARDLAKLLGYKDWRNFTKAIVKAKDACNGSRQAVSAHFGETTEIVRAGATNKPRENYHLTRYACYLIVQNADPSKPIVAMGQTYFAVQTRRQELQDNEVIALSEDQKRLVYRSQMSIFNNRLAEAAQQAGVIEAIDFAIFQDHGYKGLYAGETAAMIAARKNLEPGQHILDYMESEELGANIFRATQTEAKLRRESVTGKDAANQTHYEVGRKVRQTIEELGGTMPEDLPTPGESIQELERKERKRLKGGE